ncbi:MAG TPA: ABC transporter ATP-binding protein [Solirubrobacteraceae bacterium]|jgi:putative ABC transport system ATP-binding protein|nr:ABC transporter ATP-binding protein [Solirubrobacteraceae bacterium]
MLELEGAYKRYESPGEVIRAVEDVTLKVLASEFVAIFGPSGSGKTTLLLLAGGLLRADAGTVRFDGADLGALSRREMLEHRRNKVGLVFQDFRLSEGLSAEENVVVPLLMRGMDRREAARLAVGALDEVGVGNRSRHSPDRLSGGERQRVAIARALVGGPKLLLADEPTGNLDTETGESVLSLMRELPRKRGAAAILVTHDAQLTRYADRVLMMRDGRLTETGTPETTSAAR